MERKGLIVGIVVLVLAGLALMIWANQETPTSSTPRAAAASVEGRARGGGSGGGRAESASAQAIGTRRAIVDDAGVRAAPVPSGPLGSAPLNAQPAPGAAQENQAGAEDAERSAGWRLGQTRQRIASVEPRIARMRERLAELEAAGDAANVERQQRIIARFETRLGELRTEETELEAAARQDGTLGEVDQGFQDSAASESPPRAPAAAVAP